MFLTVCATDAPRGGGSMNEVLAVTCPICDAPPGEQCVEWRSPAVGAGGVRQVRDPHVYRVHAAELYGRLRVFASAAQG